MRRFIIISLLSAMTLPTLACIWGEMTNPYLFSMYRKTEFKERVEKTTGKPIWARRKSTSGLMPTTSSKLPSTRATA